MNFQTKVAIDGGDNPIPKCAKPEINIVDGKVTFSCETEGVEYVSEVTVNDTKNQYSSEIKLSQKYIISVYATKAGYENSDVTTTEITFSGDPVKIGDMNKDGKLTVTDVVQLVDAIMTTP